MEFLSQGSDLRLSCDLPYGCPKSRNNPGDLIGGHLPTSGK